MGKRKNKRWIDKLCQYVLIATLTILFVVLLILVNREPRGHYEGTETRQPDGSYYVWVADE